MLPIVMFKLRAVYYSCLDQINGLPATTS